MSVTFHLAIPDVAFGKGVATQGHARAVFEALQDRHVPITPLLAHHLAACAKPPSPAAVPVWGDGFARAGEALGLAGMLGARESWTSVFDVFVRVVAEPVIRAAASREGMHLVTTGSVLIDGLAGDYRSYAARMESAVASLLHDPGAMPEGFWSYAGASLLAEFRTRIAQGGRVRVGEGIHQFPACPEPLTTRIVFETEPDFADGAGPRIRWLKAKVRSDRDRSGRRPREGGVTGVDHSRRLEEIGDALPSTFLIPMKLLPLKISEEGFAMTARPPHLHPARDVLTMAFNTAPIPDGPAAVVKAAWVDATIRLRHILVAMEHNRCELGWCDLTELGPLPVAMTTEDLRPGAIADPMVLPDEVRRRMIGLQGQFSELLATYPSERAQRAARKGIGRSAGGAAGVAARRSLEGAVRAAIEGAAVRRNASRDRAQTRERNTAAITAEDYGVVFAVGVPPFPYEGGSGGPEWSLDKGTLQRQYGLRGLRRVVAAGVYPPPQLDGSETCFMVVSDRNPEPRKILFDQDLEPKKALARLIGDLSAWFITETLEAIHAG